MSPNRFDLPALQEAAIILLISGHTSYQTSALLGVEHSSVLDWINYDKAFQEDLEKRRQEPVSSTLPKPTDATSDPPAQISIQEKLSEPEQALYNDERQRDALKALYDLVDSKSQQQENLIQELRKSASPGIRANLYLGYVQQEQKQIKSLHKIIAEIMKGQKKED